MAPSPIARYRVLYLGASLPTLSKEGLMGIQEPLKDLLRHGVRKDFETAQQLFDPTILSADRNNNLVGIPVLTRPGNNAARGIDCWFSVWSNGLLLEYVQPPPKGTPPKIFHPIQTLHFCAAVKCHGLLEVTEEESEDDKKKKKDFLGSLSKLERAVVEKYEFLPVDSPIFDSDYFSTNHDRVASKNSCLQAPVATSFPPIFTCTVRRTHGVRVLECHAFLCKSDQVAFDLCQRSKDAYIDNLDMFGTKKSRFLESETLESTPEDAENVEVAPLSLKNGDCNSGKGATKRQAPPLPPRGNLEVQGEPQKIFSEAGPILDIKSAADLIEKGLESEYKLERDDDSLNYINNKQYHNGTPSPLKVPGGENFELAPNHVMMPKFVGPSPLPQQQYHYAASTFYVNNPVLNPDLFVRNPPPKFISTPPGLVRVNSHSSPYEHISPQYHRLPLNNHYPSQGSYIYSPPGAVFAMESAVNYGGFSSLRNNVWQHQDPHNNTNFSPVPYDAISCLEGRQNIMKYGTVLADPRNYKKGGIFKRKSLFVSGRPHEGKRSLDSTRYLPSSQPHRHQLNYYDPNNYEQSPMQATNFYGQPQSAGIFKFKSWNDSLNAIHLHREDEGDHMIVDNRSGKSYPFEAHLNGGFDAKFNKFPFRNKANKMNGSVGGGGGTSSRSSTTGSDSTNGLKGKSFSKLFFKKSMKKSLKQQTAQFLDDDSNNFPRVGQNGFSSHSAIQEDNFKRESSDIITNNNNFIAVRKNRTADCGNFYEEQLRRPISMVHHPVMRSTKAVVDKILLTNNPPSEVLPNGNRYPDDVSDEPITAVHESETAVAAPPNSTGIYRKQMRLNERSFAFSIREGISSHYDMYGSMPRLGNESYRLLQQATTNTTPLSNEATYPPPEPTVDYNSNNEFSPLKGPKGVKVPPPAPPLPNGNHLSISCSDNKNQADVPSYKTFSYTKTREVIKKTSQQPDRMMQSKANGGLVGKPKYLRNSAQYQTSINAINL